MADTPRRIYRGAAHTSAKTADSAVKGRGTDSLNAPSVDGAAAIAADSRYDRSEPSKPEPPGTPGKPAKTQTVQYDPVELPDEEPPKPKKRRSKPARAEKTKAKAKRKAKDDTPPTPEEIIKKRRRRCADAEDIAGFFSKLIAMVVLLALLFGFAFGVTPMENDDMAPRISAGDLLFYYRLADDWTTGDVMVFEKDGEQYVGRIVANPGDTVEVTDQATLVVNGSTVLENDIYYTTPKYDDGPAYPVTLAQDEFFILCDYREGARDSRYFGPVKAGEVKGKVITVIRRSGL